MANKTFPRSALRKSQSPTRLSAAKRSTLRTLRSSLDTGKSVDWPNLFGICWSTRNIHTMMYSMSKATLRIFRSMRGPLSRTHWGYRFLQYPTWLTEKQRSRTHTPLCSTWRMHTLLNFLAKIRMREVKWTLCTHKWKKSSKRQLDHAILRRTSQLLHSRPN